MDENDNYLDAEWRIKKEIIKEGRSGKKPNLTWTCHVKLEANNPQNANFSSDYIQNEAQDITLENGDWFVDRMIESCIKTMYLEEEAKFTIPLTKAVALNDNIKIEVKIFLESWTEKPLLYEWGEEEKIAVANKFKADGVELFKANRIRHAFNKFSTALKFTSTTDYALEPKATPNEEIKSLRVALYNNMAGCQLHYKNYNHAIELCGKSLAVAPSAKAYYRRGLAWLELKDYEKAENDLIELLKLEPKNKVALEKIKLIRELDKNNRENYKGILKKMFS